MRELSLNILDIAQNSISAGASLITIDVSESREEHLLTLTVSDNGCGMDEEQLRNVCDPFFTTRTTRKVFHSDSIDFTPLGDMTSTVTVLISMNTDRDFIYRRSADEKEFVLDTREIKNILDGVPLDNPDVVQWMKEYIDENTALLKKTI